MLGSSPGSGAELAYLFIYGTLMRGARGAHPLARSVTDEASYVDLAWVFGELYDLGAYPGLREAPAPARVHGELWQLPRDPAGLMTALDRYEGCGPDDPLPHEFRRTRIRAHTAAGQSVTALTYLWCGAPEAARGRITSGRWPRETASS